MSYKGLQAIIKSQAIFSYITLFRIRFINGLQYRIAAYAGISTQFTWGFMNILLFYAFYSENPANFPMTFEQFAAFTWLQQAFLMLFATWSSDNAIFDDITSGNIAYELARPVDLYNMWVVRSMATRLAKVILRCLPILFVAFFLPKPFGLILPVSLPSLGLFIISMVSGFILVNTYIMYSYIIAFYTINSRGVRLILQGFTDLMSGFIIQLPFFPDKIYRVLNVLPFASMQTAPYYIYSGYIGEKEAVYRICMQIFWIIIVYITGQYLMKRALKKVIIQGG